jgi:nicotinamidase-related amidase
MDEVRTPLAEASGAFLAWLEGWYAAREDVSLDGDLLVAAGGAGNVAVLVVDLLVGFCSEGRLASPRVGALGPKAAEFLTRLHAAGLRHFLLAADAHPPDSPEFAAFPPHCIVGTREAELIPELTELPFASEMVTISKRSLAVGLETEFAQWQQAHPDVRTWIILGDCTDLCVYHAAMHLRLRANIAGEDVRVVVPANLVDTYDLPVETALQIGALPHDAELLHRLFLYHLALNGVRVVRGIVD